MHHRNGALIVEHGALALALQTDAPVRLALDESLTFDLHPDEPVTIVVSAEDRGHHWRCLCLRTLGGPRAEQRRGRLGAMG